MNFSGTAFEEREKETKALKGFLVLSLIGSLGFHVGVFASGIGNYLTRVSQAEEEPIEITIIDTPQEKKVEEEPKPKPSPQKVEVQEKTEVLTSSTSNARSEGIVKAQSQVNPVQLPTKIELPPLPKPIIQPKQTIAPEEPIQRLVENLKKPIEPVKPQVQPEKRETNLAQKPVDQAREKPLEKPIALSNDNSSNSSNSRSNLCDTLLGLRDSHSNKSVATTNISGSGTPGNGTPGGGGGGGTSVLTGSGTGSIGGSGTGTGTGSGSGSGSGTGTGSSNGSNGGNSGNNSGGERIATASTNPKLPSNGDGEGNSQSNSDGRAACRECNVKYSETARRRKAEGRVAVSVDTDANGNVTNVRLIGSSGDRELDEEHLRQARNWKLKPSESGRQGVQIATEYAIQGSRRHSQVKKQQQEREERERQREIAAPSSNNNSAEEIPKRRRTIEASISGGSDVPVTSRRHRHSLESASEQSGASSEESRVSRRLRPSTEATPTRVRGSEGESSLSNRLRRRQPEVTSDVRTSPEAPQPTSRRRRREPKPSSQSSDSGSRLRDALRRSRESTPVAAPSPGSSQ